VEDRAAAAVAQLSDGWLVKRALAESGVVTPASRPARIID